MQKSWFYLGILSSLVTILTGCSGEGENKAANPAPSASPTTASSPAPTNPTTAASPAPSTSPVASNFTKPTVAGKKTEAAKPTETAKNTPTAVPAIDVVAGLIPPTDADDWSKTVSKGRPDPFAAIQLQPVEVISADDKILATTTAKQLPTPQVKPSTHKSASKPRLGKPIKAQPSQIVSNPKPRIEQPSPKLRLGKAIKPKNTLIANNPKITNSKVKFVTLATSGGKKSLPGITAGATTGKVATKTNQSGSTPKIALREIPSDIPSIKPAPIKAEPLQARAVEISGVIQIGGKTQVIVKLPTESFSRYVEVGDRIANGSVLIKRVEGEQSLSPIVVLEEVGIEVPRQLGDGVKAPSAGDPPTSAAPQP